MTDTATDLELDGYFRKNTWQHTDECMSSTERFCMAACHDARHAEGWVPPGGWPEGMEPVPEFDPNAIAWEDGPPGYFFGATDSGWEVEVEPGDGGLLKFTAKLGDTVLHGTTSESNVKAAVQAQIEAYSPTLDNIDPEVVGSVSTSREATPEDMEKLQAMGLIEEGSEAVDETPEPVEPPPAADAPDLVEPDVTPEPEEPPAPVPAPVDDEYDAPIPVPAPDEYDAPAPAPAPPAADDYDAPVPAAPEPEPAPAADVAPEPPADTPAPEPIAADPTESGVAASGELSTTVVPGEPAPAPADDRNPDAMPIPEDHHYESKFACIIRCKDEADQKRIFDELTERGYEIKLTAV